MNVRAIRGATTVENDEPSLIKEAVVELLSQIIKKNSLLKNDVVSCVFTMTKDLKSVYPAKYAREELDFIVPLMCYQELDIENSLEKCIRVLITYNSEKSNDEIKHIYLKNAKALRKDIK